jgi:hypothetical protein
MAAPYNQVYIQGQGNVSADGLNTFPQNVTNVATARTFSGAVGMQIILEGFNTPGDGGAGTFWWNSGAVPATDDSGVTTIVPSGNTAGYWVRQGSGASGPDSLSLYIGGYLWQWGSVELTTTTGSVVFPTAYSSGPASVLLTPLNGTAGGLFQSGSWTTTGFTITQANSASQGYSWLVIGK